MSQENKKYFISSLDCKSEVETLPSALESLQEIQTMIKNRKPTIFLDYDGTLTPITEQPEQAILSPHMRSILQKLAQLSPLAIITGRDLKDIQNLVKLDTIFYAGSHGFDIVGPKDLKISKQYGSDYLPLLEEVENILSKKINSIKGVKIERKKYSIAVHFRQVLKEDEGKVKQTVDEIVSKYLEIRKISGKKVIEVQPAIDWNKGRALCRLIKELKMESSHVLPFYIGDDVTDEDAFKVIQKQGVGVRVGEESIKTHASYKLRNPEEVYEFFKWLVRLLKGENT